MTIEVEASPAADFKTTPSRAARRPVPERCARLDTLRERVRSGQYRLDPLALAEAIIRDEVQKAACPGAWHCLSWVTDRPWLEATEPGPTAP